MVEGSQYIKEFHGATLKGTKKQPRATLTEAQALAVILKIEDKLNNRQIADIISEKFELITPMSIGRWWTRKHVKREIKRVQEKYNEELMPAMALYATEMRLKVWKEMETRINAPSSRLSELVGLSKHSTEIIQQAEAEIIEDDENHKAKENLDAVWNALTEEEQEAIANRLAFGDKSTVIEAEVIDDDDRAIEAGTDKEEST